MADALDLGSSGEILAGSTPAPRTSAVPEDGPFQPFDVICVGGVWDAAAGETGHPAGFMTARFPAYRSALGALASTPSSGAAGSLTRHAMKSETTHNATPESVNVGR